MSALRTSGASHARPTASSAQLVRSGQVRSGQVSSHQSSGVSCTGSSVNSGGKLARSRSVSTRGLYGGVTCFCSSCKRRPQARPGQRRLRRGRPSAASARLTPGQRRRGTAQHNTTLAATAQTKRKHYTGALRTEPKAQPLLKT